MKDQIEFFGAFLVIRGPVKFIGPPDQDPANNHYFQFWASAYRRVFEDLENKSALENNQKPGNLPPKNDQNA